MSASESIVSAGCGDWMYKLSCELFSIARSITEDGVRQCLRILRRELTVLRIEEVPTGTQCFDWKVPPEWNIRDAYIKGHDGRKLINHSDNKLHVLGRSKQVHTSLSLEALDRLVHTYNHNPLTVQNDLLTPHGLELKGLYFYHFHALPPVFEHTDREEFRRLSAKLEENPADWRGLFMCSTFIVHAQKA